MDAEEEVRKKKKQTYRQIDRQKKRNLDQKITLLADGKRNTKTLENNFAYSYTLTQSQKDRKPE